MASPSFARRRASILIILLRPAALYRISSEVTNGLKSTPVEFPESEALSEIAPLLGQCPKKASTNQDIEGAICDRQKLTKCCNHACRYRTSKQKVLPLDIVEKLTAMGKHPSEACCREAVSLGVDGNWTCRGGPLPQRELFEQISRGPMEHRWYSFASSLVQLYESGVAELENMFFSERFYFKGAFTAGEALSKPMVMMLGGYSTGKTTFIKNLLGEEYRGMHIGAEPTTDRYTVIHHGKKKEMIPGEILAVDKQQAFGTLTQFGNGFLRNFQGVDVDSSILHNFSIIDTPGVLAGKKQFNRDYDCLKVSRWFADRSDIILLMFDVHKIDISDELKRVIRNLGPNQYKVRIVLNKADTLPLASFIRSYGGLMYGLGRVFDTPELKRIYVGSFTEGEYNPTSEGLHDMFSEDHARLMSDLQYISRETLMEKLNKFIHRVKLAKAHATLLDHLRTLMVTFGKEKKKRELISSLPIIYKQIEGSNGVASGDLPDVNYMQEKLESLDFSKIPKLKSKHIKRANDVLSEMVALTAVTRSAFTSS